ncbi:MAG: DUF2382 domain-containing protein [Verrucomicrobiaceae bacterium]|nr:MAG: DUF2382 domain-containing protein [Verrucomicrobiaceae bacterium]
MSDVRNTKHGNDTNPDPITGEPGSHPIGTGAGAAGGGLTGVAIGTAVGGPIGGAVGAVIGALAGAFAGKGIAEAIDPTAEDAYWREQHPNQTFAQKEHSYDKYAPAYRTGYQGYGKHQPGTRFEDAEPTLRNEYETLARERNEHTASATATGGGATSGLGSAPGAIAGSTAAITSSGETIPAHSPLAWEEAKPAAKAAWDRVERGEAIRVPLSEEQVNVSKREVENGSAQVHKVVKSETVNQPVELKEEQIRVEKITSSPGGKVPENAFQEENISVPLKREEAVVEKTAHVTGEVKIRKTQESETQQVHETVRKEELKVDETDQARVRRTP